MADFPKPKPPARALTVVPIPRDLSAGLKSHTRPSKCVSPRTAPLDWIYYAGKDGSVGAEIEAVLSALSSFEREMVASEMDAIVEAASIGMLEDGEDIDEVSIDPDMWELRFFVEGRPYRLYFAEPYSHPEHLVALRFHEKLILPTQQEIDDAQDKEMGVAAIRLRSGFRTEWGSAA